MYLWCTFPFYKVAYSVPAKSTDVGMLRKLSSCILKLVQMVVRGAGTNLPETSDAPLVTSKVEQGFHEKPILTQSLT